MDILTRPEEANKIISKLVYVLDTKANAGCDNKEWKGFENGNGTEFGSDIDKLIKRSKKYLNSK